MYWFLRTIMRYLSVLFSQQCSGKRRRGQALEWCSQTAFHNGVCTSYQGEEFGRPEADDAK